MGFGLTISKMIVQQLKGNITAESIQNVGSKFIFEIEATPKVFDASLEEMESVPIFEDCSINPPLVADFHNENIFSTNSIKHVKDERNSDKAQSQNEIEEQKEEMKIEWSIHKV